MNLRPSNLEQASRPTAIAREAVVPERDAFGRVPAAKEPSRVSRGYAPLGMFVLLLGGLLTIVWGGLVLWLVVRAIVLAMG